MLVGRLAASTHLGSLWAAPVGSGFLLSLKEAVMGPRHIPENVKGLLRSASLSLTQILRRLGAGAPGTAGSYGVCACVSLFPGGS